MTKNINIKAFFAVLLAVSLVTWFAIAFFKKIDQPTLWEFAKTLPTVLTIDLLLFFVFAKWGWRWKWFKGWLVPFPDINGTWQGTIKSNWIDPNTGKTTNSIPAILTIKQSFMCISCVMRTTEMTSYSFAEGFRIDGDNQVRQLIYSS